ncbi:MAG: putative zinc-binding metallopeptidase [Gammaproteobacteria bacterium]
MKKFNCSCGQPLYFENSWCTYCNKQLAYSFETDSIYTLEIHNQNVYITSNEIKVRLCKNYTEFNTCNACIPINQDDDWCLACLLNQTIPDLSHKNNIKKWAKLESAKRRLIRTLLALDLIVIPKNNGQQNGLAFAFLEDQQQNVNAEHEFILTGHHQGLITINLAEADDASREGARELMGELYRTPLGHLRHESGHYYFETLIQNTKWIDSFRKLFGNENLDYQQALSNYYANKKTSLHNDEYISEYAKAHPLEDWAECWAHYLHMTDTLETAMPLI